VKDLINIGKITGTHHLKGTVKVVTNLENLKEIIDKKVIIKLGETKRVLTVKNLKSLSAKRIAIDFEEVTTKSQASSLAGAFILIKRDLIPGLADDEYLQSDLLGMTAYNVDGRELGKIENIFETAAHDIYVIGEGKKEIMIPAIDHFVKEIDFDNDKIIVELIEGMEPEGE